MSTVVKGFHGPGNSLLLKGASERVISKCSTYKDGKGGLHELTHAGKEKLIRDVNNIAKEGLRCLGIAVIYDAGEALRDLNESNTEEKLSEISKYGKVSFPCFLSFFRACEK
jgi:magnesium-transporting ATPase (P-type)